MIKLNFPPGRTLSREELNESFLFTHRQYVQSDWLIASNLPSPNYDSFNDWKLDEFAMYCDPDGLTTYKGIQSSPAKQPFDKFLEEFPKTIQRQLLEPKYRVEGIRPGCYEPEVIPRVLLQHMLLFLETSELLDPTSGPDQQRRYEHVRVFQVPAPLGSKKRGRHEKYTYEETAAEIQRQGLAFPSQAALIRHFLDNLRLKSTGKRPKKGPAWHTVKDAMSRHGLEKFVTKT